MHRTRFRGDVPVVPLVRVEHREPGDRPEREDKHPLERARSPPAGVLLRGGGAHRAFFSSDAAAAARCRRRHLLHRRRCDDDDDVFLCARASFGL